MTKLCSVKALSSITAKKFRHIPNHLLHIQNELTHWQANNTRIDALSSQVDHLSKRLEQQIQENKGLIEEKAFVSQLQDQHSIELAKNEKKLDDACKHYQNTLEEEQSKLQLVTQKLKESESRIVQLKADANKNADALKAQMDESMEVQGVIASLQQDLAAADLDKEEFSTLRVKFEHFRGESQSLKAERDKLLQDIEKMSQSEAALPKEFQVQSEELQARKVKCGCVYFLQEPNLLLFISGQEGLDVLSGVHHRPGKGWQFRAAGIWLCLLLALSFTD